MNTSKCSNIETLFDAAFTPSNTLKSVHDLKALNLLLQVQAQDPGGALPVWRPALVLNFQAAAGTELEPGIVAVIQSFGDRINFHPHLHFLVTEGGVDKAGIFHRVSSFDDGRLASLFAREVLGCLFRRELLSPDWAKRLLSWRHTGFSVHSRVRAKTRPEAERVGKYMIRPVLSLERLSFLESEGKVRYRYDQNGADPEAMDYLEFIARVTSHIPDKGQVMVRYYGLYANAHRGKMRKAGVPPLALRMSEKELKPVPSKGWAAMIQRDDDQAGRPLSRPSL